MEDYTTLVADVKEDCIKRGIIPNPQSTNEHAFHITARVALRIPGAKLVLKTPPQNCAAYGGKYYSLDAIAFPAEQVWVDCLVGAGPPSNMNAPSWQVKRENFPTQLTDPIQMDLAAPEIPAPHSDLETRLRLAEERLDRIEEVFAILRSLLK